MRELQTSLRRLFLSIYYGPSNHINKVIFKTFRVRYGQGLQTKGLIYLRSAGTMVIGTDVRINSSATSNPIGGGDRTYFQILRGATLTIGSNTGISNAAFTCAVGIEIGSNVRIGAGACIFDTDFHSLNAVDRSARRYGGAETVATRRVLIEDYAFIGMRAIILKGATIGRGSVVGAGSVVRGQIPPNEVWAGNPACFVRKLRANEKPES